MPKHLTVENLVAGSIVFYNSKKSIITFAKPFAKAPRVAVTLMDTSSNPPYVTTATKTGFTINFQQNFSGEVQWVAIER